MPVCLPNPFQCHDPDNLLLELYSLCFILESLLKENSFLKSFSLKTSDSQTDSDI